MTNSVDQGRLRRIERTIEQQKVFLHRVPDPDTRERAEGHLMMLVEMRDRLLAGEALSLASAA